MAVIGTRVKKFHFKVKSMLTLATVEADSVSKMKGVRFCSSHEIDLQCCSVQL